MSTIKEAAIVCALLILVVFTGVTAASGAQRFNVKCTDNLRNLRRAAQQYENDHDGVIPPVVLPVKSNAVFWPNRLLPYIGNNTQVFYCPQKRGFLGGVKNTGKPLKPRFCKRKIPKLCDF